MNHIMLSPRARFAIDTLDAVERSHLEKSLSRLSEVSVVTDDPAVKALTGVNRTFILRATEDIRVIFHVLKSGTLFINDIIRRSSAAAVAG